MPAGIKLISSKKDQIPNIFKESFPGMMGDILTVESRACLGKTDADDQPGVFPEKSYQM